MSINAISFQFIFITFEYSSIALRVDLSLYQDNYASPVIFYIGVDKIETIPHTNVPLSLKFPTPRNIGYYDDEDLP